MAFKTREESDGKVIVIECPSRVDLSVAKDLREIMKESTERNKFGYIRVSQIVNRL